MKKLVYFVKLMIPVVMIATLFYAVKNIKMYEISCKSQYGECSTMIKDKLNTITDCDYFKCRKSINSILDNTWTVDKYAYQLKIPLKIEVNLTEKKPNYSIKSISENRVVQVDSNGLVLDKRETSNLPGFIIEGNLQDPGSNVSDELLFALQLTSGTSKIQDVDFSRLDGNNLHVDLKDGKRIIFPLEGDRDFILGALTLILNELKKVESESGVSVDSVSQIDLRFNNPVLN